MNSNQSGTINNEAATCAEEGDGFYPNGISASTGLPITADVASMAEEARKEVSNTPEAKVAKQKEATQAAFGVEFDVNPNNLEEAGWGVVFHANAPDSIKKALKPLLEHRSNQAGKLFRVFENGDGFRPDDTCRSWLERHHVSQNVVSPEMGVPFYLMLVGSPLEIPFEFQYQLDIFWGVGRLYFDEVDDYGRYAQSVVAYETGKSVPNSKSSTVFSTAHDFDRATLLFSKVVATPLAKGDDIKGAIGSKMKYTVEPFIGETATKETLACILSGRSPQGPPALLVTGTHGMSFEKGHARQAEAQGALVCQNWSGYGNITESDYFTAAEVPDDAQLSGLIHFFFACYGAGCPKFDDFPERLGEQPRQIAPDALMSRLPQKLLAHPNGGALAVFGHVDRAWTHSFYSPRAGAQLQGFREVMGRILRGDRVGIATDQFDVRRASLASELADIMRDIEFNNSVPDAELVRLWTARNDARDYVMLGDPAVRLRVEDLRVKA